jgi:hypothetical protein
LVSLRRAGFAEIQLSRAPARIADKSIKDWPFNVKLTRNGASWNLTNIARLIVKEPNTILVLKRRFDASSPKKIAEAFIEGKYNQKKDLEERG